ncbi:MAG: glucosamine-6-phosphate deaminase [Chitinophagaceae bacterium]|jgi:glucosamine-6-phosphate deaminase|uniref:glucosamine-6-phosphate deaminase n=1 Tax=unclassified Paraflavitalea TaxID=2798305 RepID=UPI003D353D2D|nr:glucosamine-6-phosphate deaminase [Chitinophagaceae bacterium]
MIGTTLAGMMKVKIYGTRKKMGYAAASMVAERIRNLLQQQEVVNIVFAAAPSQLEMLEALRKEVVDWERVNAFHMDEYIGLPAGAVQSFGFFLKKELFSQLPFRNVFYINGACSDPQSECERYSQLLEAFPTDIVCMGIGENGHLAFNDPPVANFKDPVRVKIVTLDNECRQQQVNDGCFPSLDTVPEKAITLTIPALMAAAYISCVVPGERKAQAVYNTMYENIDTRFPSTVLREHAKVILFLDEASAAKTTFIKTV